MELPIKELEQIRNKMEDLIKGIDGIDLEIEKINKKDKIFNVYYENDSTYIHIRTHKFKIKGNNLEFSTRITYNKEGESGRKKDSPGSISSLLDKIKVVYPPISNVIENEKFLQKAQWKGIFIPLGTVDDIDEAARRLLLFVGLKLFYTPGKKPAFAINKFEKLYAKIGTGDIKQKITNEDNKQNKLFYIINAIKTKPFIILSGISGTGKTQIARLIPIMLEEAGMSGYREEPEDEKNVIKQSK